MIRPATRTAWGALAALLLAAIAGAIWQMPMAQALRWLPAATHGALSGRLAEGRWHQGAFALICATPNGRLLDCGRYGVVVRGSLASGGAPLQVSARQPAGGVLLAQLGVGTWQFELQNLRLPMAALSMALPMAEQMQLGGDVLVDGDISASGRLALSLRWLSEFGEFSTGEQRLRIEGGENRYQLHFLPPLDPDLQRKVSLTGTIGCERVPGKAGGRCRGEVDVLTDQSVAKLESLLAASAPQLSPGHYRLRVDAQ